MLHESCKVTCSPSNRMHAPRQAIEATPLQPSTCTTLKFASNEVHLLRNQDTCTNVQYLDVGSGQLHKYIYFYPFSDLMAHQSNFPNVQRPCVSEHQHMDKEA